MRRTISITIVLATAILLSACVPDREPADFSLPKAKIIYQALNDQLGGQGPGLAPSNNLIGFVNADGTENVLLKLKYRAYDPIFSLEAGGIFFHANTFEPPTIAGGAGPTYFLSTAGVYKACNQVYTASHAFPVKGTTFLLTYDLRDINLLDIRTCTVAKSLVGIPDETPWVKFIDSAYPSWSGKSVLFTQDYRSPSRNAIYVMDLQSGKVKEILEGGMNATFSPDDQRIAYDGEDGIYIANTDGTGNRLLVSIDFNNYINGLEPFPFWSTDGSTLVYHKCTATPCYGHDLSNFSIYKFDVNSGVEQKIIDGGIYPTWIN